MTTAVERIRARITETDLGYTSPCWVVSGKPNDSGYAQINVDGKPRRCHRVMYEAVNGSVPDDLDHLCHTLTQCPGGFCQHRLCCNPAHLTATTKRDNMLTARTPQRLIAESGLCGAGLHPWTPKNTRTWIDKKGRLNKSCKGCAALREKTRVRVR